MQWTLKINLFNQNMFYLTFVAFGFKCAYKCGCLHLTSFGTTFFNYILVVEFGRGAELSYPVKLQSSWLYTIHYIHYIHYCDLS